MLGSSAFLKSFSADSSDRIVVLKRALNSGFHLVLNQMNEATPLCPLTAKAKREADYAAGQKYRDEGDIQRADNTKHECGLAHALGPDDVGRVTALINRLGNQTNLGLHLGLSNFLAVNIDTAEQHEIFLEYLRHLSPDIPELATTKTPGTKVIRNGQEVFTHENGVHYLFKVNPETQPLPENISKYVTAQGWSIMWGQSQVLVPPSRKPEGAYVLQNAPNDLPNWLYNIVCSKAQDAEAIALSDLDVVAAGQTSPFSQAAKQYRAAGWDPFPLVRKNDKYSPFKRGYTGARGKVLSDEAIDKLVESKYDLSIAIRFPKNIIAIDVDGYDGKEGTDALFDLEYNLGKLPPTYRNTARLNDPISGHRFYRVPDDVEFVDRIGNRNIEILSFKHRYANVWPTINLKISKVYRYIDDRSGEVMSEGFIPGVDEILDLPVAWVEYLRKKERVPGQKLNPDEMTDDIARDGLSIAKRSVAKLENSPPGVRNNQLNTTSYLLGRMVSADIIQPEEAEEWVTKACEENGLLDGPSGQTEVQRTFNSGMNAGINDPWTPEDLDVVDPEPVITEDFAPETTNRILEVLKAHKNPSMNEISSAYEAIIRVCKTEGMTPGQTVSILFSWASLVPSLNIDGQKISREIVKLWDLVDFIQPRMVARDAKRKIKRFKFLWDKRIPLGGLTFLAGKGESGKTTLTANIIAGVTTGRLDGDIHESRMVYYCKPEDSFDRVLALLECAGADLDYVKEIVIESPAGMDKPPTLPDNIPDFKAMCEIDRPALIVFDPLPARMNEKLSSASDSDVRQALEPLTYLCQDLEMSALGLVHLNKKTDGDLISRMMGSVAFVNVSRSTLYVVYNTQTEERYVGLMKSNLVARTKVPTLKFKIVSDSFLAEIEGEAKLQEIEGTKVQFVGEDPRSIEECYYQTAAIEQSMKEQASKEKKDASVGDSIETIQLSGVQL